jgi:molecular chaperone GrpE
MTFDSEESLNPKEQMTELNDAAIDELFEEDSAVLDETNSEESQTKEAPKPPSLEDWKEKYIRTLAEQENMRKRMQKEKQELLRYSYENCMSEFLAPLDNLENALRFTEQATSEVKNWATGFQMILAQFKEVLHNHGVVAFHSEGNTFDPHYHEAVEILETDEHSEGTILKEFTKGYKSASRTIRPARVKVAKKPKCEEVSTPCEEPTPEAININQKC